MRTRLFGHNTVVLVLLFACQSVFAQQQAIPTGTADQLSAQAYKMAQSAKTLEQFTESLRICGQAMKASPTVEQKQYIQQLAGWTYNKRGEALVGLAEQTVVADAKRAAQYEEAAAKDFGLSVQFDDSRWKPRFNRAVSKAMAGQYDAALFDLDFVITKQPTHKNALFNRAEILLQLGDFDPAIADYSEVIKLDGNDGAAYAGRGIALAAKGDTQNAMLDLNSVVRLKPDNASGYVDRADLYAALGDFERAAGDYRVAIGLDEKSARAYQNVAWLMATCPIEKFRKPQLAVRAAKKALELEGATYLGLDTYAAALASVGEFQKAAAAQQQAISTAPAGEQAPLQNRLALYKQQRPFVERPNTQPNIRLATAEEDLE